MSSVPRVEEEEKQVVEKEGGRQMRQLEDGPRGREAGDGEGKDFRATAYVAHTPIAPVECKRWRCTGGRGLQTWTRREQCCLEQE